MPGGGDTQHTVRAFLIACAVALKTERVRFRHVSVIRHKCDLKNCLLRKSLNLTSSLKHRTFDTDLESGWQIFSDKALNIKNTDDCTEGGGGHGKKM